MIRFTFLMFLNLLATAHLRNEATKPLNATMSKHEVQQLVTRAELMTRGGWGWWWYVGIGKLQTARSRLYRNRFLRPNMHFSSLILLFNFIILLVFLFYFTSAFFAEYCVFGRKNRFRYSLERAVWKMRILWLLPEPKTYLVECFVVAKLRTELIETADT